MTLTQFFVWPPHARMPARQHQAMPLVRQQIVSWRISFPPSLDQVITELVDILRSNQAVPNGPKHKVPEVFYWVEVR